MLHGIVCYVQEKQKQEETALAQLTTEERKLRDSCLEADASMFFSHDDKPSAMPLVYRKTGFTSYVTDKGNVMYLTPFGAKVRPSGQKCREHLSAALKKRPELNYLSDSVKTASPPRKQPVISARLRSEKMSDQPATPSPVPQSAAKPSPSPAKSPNAYGYFKQLSPKDQFLAICDSSKMAQFFEHFGEVARCVRVVDGQPCGGRYTVSGFVDTGTGNEMTCTISCDRCKHSRYFGDRCTNKHQTQMAQCGPVQGSDVDEATIGKTVLYNFLLAGRGKFKQYNDIFGRTGDAYSQGTFNKGVEKCMRVVMEVLDEEVKAIRNYLKETGQYKTCCIGVDGSWCTPGASAPHGMFCARAMQAWGGLLGFYFMSRNDPEHPYLLTSASMEVIGCIKVRVG